jgi:rhodanese-related sulfurtransferase
LQALDVLTLAAKLSAAATSSLQLIDVREPWEVELAAIAGFMNLPLSQFDQWSPTLLERLDPTTETIVLCHHGIRSAQMGYWLLSQGFSTVKNVTGGIAAYSLYADATIPQY